MEVCERQAGLLDLPWEDVLYGHIFPALSLRALFRLRAASRQHCACVMDYFRTCKVVDLVGIGPKFKADAFEFITGENASIRQLKLGGARDWLRDDHVVPLLERNAHLTTFDVDGCTALTNRTLHALCLYCPRLEHLRLNSCPWVSSQAVISLAARNPGLKYMDLTGCWSLDDKAVMAIARSCPELRSFTVAKVYSVTDAAMIRLAQGCRDLRYVNIQGCWRISNAAVQMLGEYCKSLDMLFVRECRFVSDISLARLRVRGVAVDIPKTPYRCEIACGLVGLNIQV